MFQSCSTEHVDLMLKQAWWTHLAIFNIETVFATHRSDEVQNLIKLVLFFQEGMTFF